MNKIKVSQIIILLFVLLTSCVSSKNFYLHYSNISHLGNSLSKLNGSYFNYPQELDINDVMYYQRNTSLDKLIFAPFHFYKWDEKRNFEGAVIIEVLSKNRIKVSYINLNNNERIKSKILNGKFINNYFEVNTRRKIIGFPFTYFTLDIEKLRIGLSVEGDLLIACKRYHFGSLFIIFGDSNHGFPLSTFKRKY
jgi:hypothetical protein